MIHSLILIVGVAFSVGLIHTLMGPDHYIPFIALSRVRKWSLSKTIFITTLCGIGHVFSAAVIGLVAILLGFSLQKLSWLTSFRGEFATWLLIVFGAFYLIWALYRLKHASKPHYHHHLLAKHEHHHHQKEVTPWALFIIFVLGPCEPLIPIMMYPAIQGSIVSVLLVVLAFGLATLIAMLGVVIAASLGLNHFKFEFLGKYGHIIAGSIILVTGVMIKIFGL